MMKMMNGIYFGQDMLQMKFYEIWIDTKNLIIFQDPIISVEKIVCTKIFLEWNEDLVMTTIYVQKLMYSLKISNNLTMIRL